MKKLVMLYAAVLLSMFSCAMLPIVYAEDVHIGDQNMKVCFSPHYTGISCTVQIVSVINAAQKSIYVQAYSFTSQGIVDALIAAHKRGIDVEIILDKSNLHGKGNKTQDVIAAGIPTWIDSKHAIAHNKVMIIDDSSIITGSFNFTSSAELHNAENSVVITGKELADIYLINWKKHLSHSIKKTN